MPAGSIKRVLVSMAHMHLLPIGRLVQGQDGTLLRLAPTDLRQRKCALQIDLRRNNTEIVTRASLPHRGPAGEWLGDPRYDGLLIRARRTQNTPEVLIPCSSLFQFYWGVTSTLSDAVLSGKLEDLGRWFYRPERTGFESDGTFTLDLRRQWEDSIAGYLATILTDPDAIESGRRILRRLIAQKQGPQSGEILRLEVLPPFPRLTLVEGYFSAPDDLQVADSGPVFLTHIVSASLSPNWRAVRFYRENDSRRTATEVTSGEPAPAGCELTESPIVTSGIQPPALIVVTETPSGYTLNGADLPLLATIDQRFPDLAEHAVVKAPKEGVSESDPRVRPRKMDGPWSAIPGSLGAGQRVRQGKLVGGEGALPEGPAQTDLELGLEFETVDEQLSEFALAMSASPIEAAVSDQPITVQVEFLDLYDSAAASPRPVYFRLPKTVANEAITWLYRDPDCKFTKRGICVRLLAKTQLGREHVRYAIDLERRIPKRHADSASGEPIKNGFLVAWFDKPMAVPETHDALRQLLHAVALNRSPSLSRRPAPGLCLANLRHGEPSSVRLVSRIFSARDQCSDDDLAPTSEGRQAVSSAS
jgi:hypothetical protein